jgi:uncharacterized membrane protein YhaH (DUF805 family)
MSKSKPVFEDLFKFKGRRNRWSYILVQLSAFAVMLAGIMLAVGSIALFDDSVPFIGYLLALVFSAGAVAAIAAAWITSAQRVRDIGHSGVWCLLQLIPYVGWIFALGILIMPGDTDEENKYGPSCI